MSEGVAPPVSKQSVNAKYKCPLFCHIEMSAMGGSEEHFCKLLRGDWRQGLEAVGRKDLPRAAPVPGSAAGGGNGRGSATSASHPAAVRSRLALREDLRRLLPVAHPHGFPPS